MPFLLTAAVAAATVISSPSAHATIRLANDPGGLIAAYQHRFERARATGERIIIDGSCLSACTLAIGLVPREQFCVTPKAVLGFHAAWTPTPYGGRAVSVGATQHMMNIYPSYVQGWINQHGGLKPQMIFLKGDELTSMVPACSEADVAMADQIAASRNRPSQQQQQTGRMVVARAHHHRRAIYAVRPIYVPMY
jgi:hypothetical protein